MSNEIGQNSLDVFREAIKKYDMQICKDKMDLYYFDEHEPVTLLYMESETTSKPEVNVKLQGFSINKEIKPELTENVFKKKLLSKLRNLKL